MASLTTLIALLNQTSSLLNQAVICSLVKNEELYLDEWIDYHTAI